MSSQCHPAEEPPIVPLHARALELILEANQLRDQTPQSPPDIVFELFYQAVRILENAPLQDVEAQNILAKAWMSRGITLLLENTQESLLASLPCFEKAIALRQRLPLDAQPWIRYGLAAGWMNLADALTRLNSKENLTKALHGHECALHHLQKLPAAAHRSFLQRHLVARLNYSTTLLADPLSCHQGKALEILEQALSLHVLHPYPDDPELEKLKAALLANKCLALSRFQVPAAEECRLTAHQALLCCRLFETKEAHQAEISLKTRHLLCQSIALLLENTDLNPTLAGEWIHEATDAVEEGLRLGHFWEPETGEHFHSLIADLFRFGGSVYQAYQPHFMADYLAEHLNQASPSFLQERRNATLDLLHSELAAIQKEAFSLMGTDRFASVLARVGDLRRLEEQLQDPPSSATETSPPAPA